VIKKQHLKQGKTHNIPIIYFL